jgi:PRTRC genetic system protein B
MNTLTNKVIGEYKATVAVVVYSHESNYYLESHDINDTGELQAGKPLLQDTLIDMVDVFFDERKNTHDIKGLIPDNMLSYYPLPGGNYKLIWYKPAEIRMMHHAAALKLPSAKTWVPAMIYEVEKNDLNVYALNSNVRPKETSKLYKAPYFNVDDDGDVCLGNANVKKPTIKTFQNIMQYWEDLFWLSSFSHVNGFQKVKSKNLATVWKQLLNSKTKTKWSDVNELLQYKNKTLKSLL